MPIDPTHPAAVLRHAAEHASAGTPACPAWNRVLLKISGESLSGTGERGIQPEALRSLAAELAQAAATGAQIAIVLGGGNIVRGAPLARAGLLPQAAADHMGMLGTVINGIALKEALSELGLRTRVMSALGIERIVEPIERTRAIEYLETGHVVILAGGTGNPFCTTDTAASLRAAELNCNVILKATKVDGVYSADPKKHPDAVRYDRLTFEEALTQRLGVMDLGSFTMCMEQQIDIVVFNFETQGNIAAVLRGEPIGTIITSGPAAARESARRNA